MELMISNIPHLHTNTQKGYPAPHKPILLISVMDLIEDGCVSSNHIFLSDELIDKFHSNWCRYVGSNQLFTPDIGKPYWHLRNEPFWKLVPFDEGNDFLESIKNTNPYSVKKLRAIIRYAELDAKLFTLMQNKNTCAKLRVLLIEKYLAPLHKE